VEVSGGGDGLGPAADLELTVDVVDVALDGALRDDQPIRDLLVGEARGNQAQHLQLALTERLDQRLGRRRAATGCARAGR